MILLIVEVVLVLGPLTSPPIKLILAQTGMMGEGCHLRVTSKHPMWNHTLVSIIQLVLLVVLHLLFTMVMENVLWVIGPATLTPRNFIFDLMVVILCHLRVGIIHP